MKQRKLHIILILILFSKFSFPLSQFHTKNEAIYQEQLFSEKEIGFIEDSTLSVTINDLLDSNKHFNYISFDKINPNRGFSSSAYWLCITLKNTSKTNKTYLFSIEYPLINDVRFYEVFKNKIIDSIYTGENYIHKTRRFIDRYFTFKLDCATNEVKTYYIRICNIGETTRIPIRIINVSHITDFNQNDTFSSSIYYGYILFAFIFNILMFIEFRRKHFLLFSIYIFCLGFFLFIIDGYAFLYIWPKLSIFSNHALIFFSIASALSIIKFTNIFVQTRKIFIILSKILYVLGILIFIWSLIPYPHNKYSFIAANCYVFIALFSILILSLLKVIQEKSHQNIFFSLSILSIVFSVVIYILRNFGLIETSYFLNNSIKIGLAVQVTFLSAAVITQFKESFKKSNKFLEEMVQKRTIVISSQNEQLRTQNKKIAVQYKELKQSMNYAKRLQTAILPNKYKFSSLFKDHFIIYNPKDIVSGDFYWITEKNNKTYIVTADCTGHGIPGGFLSMLGISFLNQIVTKNSNIKPNEILNKLGILFSETLNDHENVITRDSMDISICLIDLVTNELEYSGAYNPIYLVRNSELHELSVDKISLRKDFTSEHITFSNKKYILHENDRIYMFTDGFADQFGGEFNKRFTKRQFKSLICNSSHVHMLEQKQIIQNAFNDWKGTHEQVDDILILGIEI